VFIPRRRFLKLGALAAASGCASSRFTTATGPQRAPSEPWESKIEHFLVLMMENRSYDQMLGALPGDEYDGLPRGARLSYEARDRSPSSVEIVRGAPPDRFAPDPGHGFSAVEAQIRSRGPGEPPDMAGFARRFVKDHPGVDRRKMAEYATIYDDGRLPVLQGLAKQYGVCTHWFCSLPSSTTPNRMFAHAGTSGGATRAGAYYSRIRGKMIFDKLGSADKTAWRVYFHDMPHLWLAGDAWTKSFGGQLRHMGIFERDVREGRLPTYAFIEPQHILPPWSSQHPSGGVSHGEKLIAHVYNTLAANPRVFERSLLLIVYDEHGGFYDHVVPPGHPGWNDQCPGVDYEVVPPDEARGSGEGREDGYAFDSLGPRVPAVVVSPWVERGSVFGWRAKDPDDRWTFDHTSILATVGKMTGAWVDSRRARAATHLGVVLNRASPRDDCPTKVVYDERAYRQAEVVADGASEPLKRTDVATELTEAWKAEHGNGSAEEMVEHYRALVGG
jgi:phospholipase C